MPYSPAFLNRQGHWITNYTEVGSADDLDWEEVDIMAREDHGHGKSIAYGYYHSDGLHSNNLTSDKCRTMVKFLEIPNYTLEEAIRILKNDGRVFYYGQQGTEMENRPVWVKVKWEQVGITACFGYNTEDKIIKRKWMTNGWSEVEEFLKNNIGIKE